MASAPQNVALQYAVDPEFWTRFGPWAYEAYRTLRAAA
jgi:putative spermidine/putrescine transport system substrate-binding protein